VTGKMQAVCVSVMLSTLRRTPKDYLIYISTVDLLLGCISSGRPVDLATTFCRVGPKVFRVLIAVLLLKNKNVYQFTCIYISTR
jgi:hypothetical protein